MQIGEIQHFTEQSGGLTLVAVMMPAPAVPRTVLVVNDEALIRMLAVETLEDAGYRVLEAASSRQAMDVLLGHDGRVDVVMTDMHMPGDTDGAGLLRHVERAYPHIRSLIVSGKALRGCVPDTAVFVPKPYSYDALVDAVCRLSPAHAAPLP